MDQVEMTSQLYFIIANIACNAELSGTSHAGVHARFNEGGKVAIHHVTLP